MSKLRNASVPVIQLCYLKISTINIFGKLELYIGSATTMLFVILLDWFLKEDAFYRSHELMKPKDNGLYLCGGLAPPGHAL